jgi:hypothetical protein
VPARLAHVRRCAAAAGEPNKDITCLQGSSQRERARSKGAAGFRFALCCTAGVPAATAHSRHTQLHISGLDSVLASVAGELVCLDAPHAARGAPTADVARFFEPPFYEWWDAQETPQVGSAALSAGH